jgi:hypothetical protein
MQLFLFTLANIFENLLSRVGFRLGQKNHDYFGLKKSCPCRSTGQVGPSVFGLGSGRARAWTRIICTTKQLKLYVGMDLCQK